MSLAVFPALLRRGGESHVLNARIFQRLSTVCGWALGVLVAAGIYNATYLLGPVSSLWTTRFGVILDVKLGLVLVMILIGAHNRYFKLPRLLRLAGQDAGGQAAGDGSVLRSCATAVVMEAVLGVAVIGTTAVLIHAMPPADKPVSAVSRVVVGSAAVRG